MRLFDTKDTYGLVSILFHWATALFVYALFFLGLYMTGLDYYDPWYHRAPDLHKSFGLLFSLLIISRLIWRGFNPKPKFVPMPPLERVAAYLIHKFFYILFILIPLSGFLISTADGRGVEFFGLLKVPALFSGAPGQEDKAGAVHLYLALFAVALSGLHMIAALRHHFIDKDATLIRMLGIGKDEHG